MVFVLKIGAAFMLLSALVHGPTSPAGLSFTICATMLVCTVCIIEAIERKNTGVSDVV